MGSTSLNSVWWMGSTNLAVHVWIERVYLLGLHMDGVQLSELYVCMDGFLVIWIVCAYGFNLM